MWLKNQINRPLMVYRILRRKVNMLTEADAEKGDQ
jgi:hypothetical protein